MYERVRECWRDRQGQKSRSLEMTFEIQRFSQRAREGFEVFTRKQIIRVQFGRSLQVCNRIPRAQRVTDIESTILLGFELLFKKTLPGPSIPLLQEKLKTNFFQSPRVLTVSQAVFPEKSFSLDEVSISIKSGTCCSRSGMENDLQGETRA